MSCLLLDEDTWEPGSAGKSSLLIVNSEVSAAGCFTIPTETKKILYLESSNTLKISPPSHLYM